LWLKEKGEFMNTKDYIALEEQYGAHNYHPLDVVIERAEGVWVYDVDGKKYLDCLSAYSAVNQGHVHPQILNALLEQAKKVTLTSRAFRNDQLPLLYKELSEMTGYEMSLPMNSGAEAVETALKLARKWAYRVKGRAAPPGGDHHCGGQLPRAHDLHRHVLHRAAYRDDFGPFTPGFVNVPYGDADAIEKAITPNTAAVMLEPIQGEGGVIIPACGIFEEGGGNLQKEQRLIHGG
jgi:ornithine--oxo-acid transaminase